MVAAAKQMGFVFTERSPTRLRYTLHGTPMEMVLVAVNPFTSDRKRMSILVRPAGEESSGGCTLYVKGADDVILPLLEPDQTVKESVQSQLAHMASAESHLTSGPSRTAQIALAGPHPASFVHPHHSYTPRSPPHGGLFGGHRLTRRPPCTVLARPRLTPR